MIYSSIALVFFLISAMGIVVIVFKKIPELKKLPEAVVDYQKDNIEEGNKKDKLLKSGFPNIFLQKIIYRVRLLSLKTDKKTYDWLQSLKEKSGRNKFEENEDYWKDIKKNKR